jgi:prepilin-type N-terminal cleavage/methylation domain-containing protein
MNGKTGKDGFTLVEILVAMGIIVTIVSMVYGSYFATSKSTQAYKTKIALFQQGRKVLEQMARQIRCSYASTVGEHTYTARSISQSKRAISENVISYFNGNLDHPTGEILHLVTKKAFYGGQEPISGLFEVTYKFDKSTGTLFFSQERFVGTSKNVVERGSWRPIIGSVKYVELEFFDGRQWLHSWDFREKGKLPSAVKMNITFEDENYQQYHYGTVAYICCRMNQDKKEDPTH